MVQSHTQVRLAFSDPAVLDPLEPNEVHQLVQAPVQAEVIDALNALLCGDLRGLLKALEDGITALLGLTGNVDGPGQIGLTDPTQVLSRRYGPELQDQLGATLWQRLTARAARDAQAVFTQAELVALWGIKQPSVSQPLQYGYQGRRGWPWVESNSLAAQPLGCPTPQPVSSAKVTHDHPM